jgi:hypothetical protein
VYCQPVHFVFHWSFERSKQWNQCARSFQLAYPPTPRHPPYSGVCPIVNGGISGAACAYFLAWAQFVLLCANSSFISECLLRSSGQIMACGSAGLCSALHHFATCATAFAAREDLPGLHSARQLSRYFSSLTRYVCTLHCCRPVHDKIPAVQECPTSLLLGISVWIRYSFLLGFSPWHRRVNWFVGCTSV